MHNFNYEKSTFFFLSNSICFMRQNFLQITTRLIIGIDYARINFDIDRSYPDNVDYSESRKWKKTPS